MLFLVCFGMLIALSFPAKAQEESLVVAELFTSQSCSSCPPADLIFSALARKDNVIALSCHVTYWNHLDWKDTLSQKFCTERQRQYTQTLKSRDPYTPQIVINGARETRGSRAITIKKWIAQESRKQDISEILLTQNGDMLDISFPVLAAGQQSMSVTLFAFDRKNALSIPSGENAGKRINYTHAVRHLVDLGSWDGSAQSLQHDIAGMDVSGGYAVLAQAGTHGPIIAAGQVKK